MLSSKLFSSISNIDRLYVDDVFSAYTYTGNGSTQTINNGIDLAGKGGLVWTKCRTHIYSNGIMDTERGTTSTIETNNSNAASTAYPTDKITTFNPDGYSIGNLGQFNATGEKFTSWTFRKAPKFFDVVTYTGNGASSRAIAHSLGQAVGMVITKATSTTGDWNTYHRAPISDQVLNATTAPTGDKVLVSSTTTTTFTVSGAANTNAVTYIAYLFAHDPSADGIIQCGFYEGNGSATGTIVNLGWEPQYLMIRSISNTGNWQIIDNMRGMPVGSADATLQANLSNAEASVDYVSPTATGFQLTSTSSEVNSSGNSYIYMAVRRPNKPPTTGTQVYNAIARTGVNSGSRLFTGIGFSPDLVLNSGRNNLSDGTIIVDRLRGGGSISGQSKGIRTWATIAETSISGVDFSATVDGIKLFDDGQSSWSNSAYNYINHFFHRAPEVFDVVCYTGTGANKTEAHNLGVAPELWIVKGRSEATAWTVGCAALANTEYLVLNTTATKATDATAWNSTYPTSPVLSLGTQATVNTSTATYVAYLFATKPGISKVGSYTGNGTSQTINCGFSAGARFILIKRTDSTGDWYVWDSTRGIVAANDPHLSLNTTAAEVTTNDSVDPDNTGFIVNQVAATNINVTGATYIFLAVN